MMRDDALVCCVLERGGLLQSLAGGEWGKRGGSCVGQGVRSVLTISGRKAYIRTDLVYRTRT